MDSEIHHWFGTTPLTDEDIDRLVEVVDREPGSRQTLKEQLESWRTLNSTFGTSPVSRTKLMVHSKSIGGHAKKLLDLIDPDAIDNPWRNFIGPASEWALQSRLGEIFPERPDLDLLRAGLQELVRVSQSIPAEPPPSSVLDRLLEGSPLETLVGNLARIYEECFGNRAGASRIDGVEPGGPFIRFAEFCLNELNFHGTAKRYAQESILDAFYKGRRRTDKITDA